MIGDERMIGAQSRKIIRSAREQNKLAISAISFWEIALLVAEDRLELRGEASQLRKDLSISGVVELSVTGDIAIGAVELANLHADPADRIIAATARAHDLAIVTRDSELIPYGEAGHVVTIAC